MRIVVTRPEPHAGELVRRLELLGHEVVSCPLIAIEPLGDEPVEVGGGAPEARDPQDGGAPIGDLREVVDEVAQGRLHLIEGADHHHHLAEGQATREIVRRGRENRHHDGEPAVARGDPGQAREAAGEAPRRLEDRLDELVEVAALVRLVMTTQS